ncbi:MAG: sigma-70 family RNA polymerase sigma factor [Kofleriaceae bacterium]|nr:sigma-70 family RNA polymerase sigma factor [Kofleriaceae bacterium]
MTDHRDDLELFEQHRPALRALAYRMLGDTASADDIVQEAWIRWQARDVEVDNPRSYLLTIATRLCLNQLSSARSRHEQLRARLPEPLEAQSEGALEIIEQVSMAFLVALQRLSPAERAVLLLHEVFDVSHADIGRLLDKTEAASRQLLKRAREGVAETRAVAPVSHDEHRRLLRAFADAAQAGDVDSLMRMLAADAVLITDGGTAGVRSGRVRTLVRPLLGAKKIAAFVTATDGAEWRDQREHVLNGQPALVAYRDGRPYGVLQLGIADGRILEVYIQADPSRLGHVGMPTGS